jgi:hypothetical protein
MRVFMAHPKSWSDDRIDETKVMISKSIEQETGTLPSVIPGRDDYNEYIYIDGSFGTWAANVATRIDTRTRQNFYRAIVVTTEVIGAATVIIVKNALTARVPVMYFDTETQEVTPVKDLDLMDPDNYQSNHALVLAKG